MAYRRVGNLGADLGSLLALEIAEGVKRALLEADVKIDKELTNKLKKLSQQTEHGLNLKSYQLAANKAIVDQVREAVVERFDEEHEYHRSLRDPQPYGLTRRPYPRGSTALREALRGSATAVATYDGIAMINSTLLYEASAFWRRLNFGSGTGTVGLPPLTFTVFGKSFGQAPTLAKKGAPNTMPPGIWFIDSNSRVYSTSRNSSDVFSPIQKIGTAHHHVREIQPWGFLNAAIERFNEVAGIEYNNMVDKVVEELRNRGIPD